MKIHGDFESVNLGTGVMHRRVVGNGESTLEAYGKVGEQIPGSRYFRDYCRRCSEPLRVTEGRLDIANYCNDCSPGEPPAAGTGLTYRQAIGSAKTKG